MGIITRIEQLLQGKKAYLVMVGGIIAAVVAYLNGDMSLMQMVGAIWTALGLGALRSGIGKSGPAT